MLCEIDMRTRKAKHHANQQGFPYQLDPNSRQTTKRVPKAEDHSTRIHDGQDSIDFLDQSKKNYAGLKICDVRLTREQERQSGMRTSRVFLTSRIPAVDGQERECGRSQQRIYGDQFVMFG